HGDDPRRVDRLALTLDAIRRQDRDRLAGRDDHPRPAGDVGGGAHGAVDGRGGALLVSADPGSANSPRTGKNAGNPHISGGFARETPKKDAWFQPLAQEFPTRAKRTV